MERASKAGYADQTTLDKILWNLVENSYSYDDQTQLLRDILDATQTTNTLLQTLIDKQLNTPVATVQNNNIEQSPREKISKKLLAACEWITANDPDNLLSVRQVATGAAVSIGTAQAAMKLIADEKRSK